jgi:hypothetical protein
LGHLTTGVVGRFHVYQNTDSKIYAFAASNPGATGQSTSSTTFSTGSWHHAAGVFASASSRTVYLNGTAGTTDTTNIASPFGTIDRFLIGVQQFSDTTTSFFDGRIAEVGIWSATLTADEIASLAKGMTCDKIRPQSLVFYAPLVRDLIDAKGGLTITNNNTATVANHPRVYA